MSKTDAVLQPASALPYTPEIIAQVLEGSILRSGGDRDVIEQLGSAYITLADFIPMTVDEQRALDTWKAITQSGQSDKAAATSLVQVGDIVQRLMERSAARRDQYVTRINAMKVQLGLPPISTKPEPKSFWK